MQIRFPSPLGGTWLKGCLPPCVTPLSGQRLFCLFTQSLQGTNMTFSECEWLLFLLRPLSGLAIGLHLGVSRANYSTCSFAVMTTIVS